MKYFQIFLKISYQDSKNWNDKYNVLFFSDKAEESREKDQLRQERHKDRARERNLARAAPRKRSRVQRGDDDVYETV